MWQQIKQWIVLGCLILSSGLGLAWGEETSQNPQIIADAIPAEQAIQAPIVQPLTQEQTVALAMQNQEQEPDPGPAPPPGPMGGWLPLVPLVSPEDVDPLGPPGPSHPGPPGGIPVRGTFDPPALPPAPLPPAPVGFPGPAPTSPAGPPRSTPPPVPGPAPGPGPNPPPAPQPAPAPKPARITESVPFRVAEQIAQKGEALTHGQQVAVAVAEQAAADPIPIFPPPPTPIPVFPPAPQPPAPTPPVPAGEEADSMAAPASSAGDEDVMSVDDPPIIIDIDPPPGTRYINITIDPNTGEPRVTYYDADGVPILPPIEPSEPPPAPVPMVPPPPPGATVINAGPNGEPYYFDDDGNLLPCPPEGGDDCLPDGGSGGMLP